MKFYTFLKKFILIAFDKLPDEKINLFEVFPSIKKFFKQRKLHRLLRTFGDFIFLFIIIFGLFGPQNPNENIIIFLSWGIWWPSIVIGWFFFSRMWCGFCPFPGLGRLLQHFNISLNLPVPKYLINNGIYISVLLFILIIFFEESLEFKESPRLTAILMLFILAGATLMAMIFQKQAWCRYLCPMGRIIGTGATMSFLEFRPDHEKCKGCASFACKKGNSQAAGCPVYLGAFNVRNNLECLVCGHCVKLCDRDSPMLNFRSPFEELVRNKGRFITCSHIIPFFMGSQIARLLQDKFLKDYVTCDGLLLCQVIYFSVLFFAAYLFILMIIRIGGDVFGVTEDETFGSFSPFVPILVPLSFGGELLIRINYFFEKLPDFFPTLQRQFAIPVGQIAIDLPDFFINFLDVFILVTSAAASFYVLYRFIADDFSGLISKAGAYASYAFIFIVLSIYLYLMPH
jgi:polyferredoxin